MARINIVNRSFDGGEVSRDLQGRQASDFYSKAVERMENFIPHPQGKTSYRPSMRHLNKTFGSPDQIIAFNSSNGEGFALVREAGGFVPYDSNGRVETEITANINGATSNKSGNIWRFEYTGAHGVSVGQIVRAKYELTSGITYVGELQGDVTAAGTNFFEVFFSEPILSGINGSFTFTEDFQIKGAVLAPGVLEQDFQYVQIANQLYIISPQFSDLVRITYTEGTNSFATAIQSLTSARENPTAIGFYEQRLILGKGNTLFFSIVNNYTNFTTGTNPNDGLEYAIAGSSNNTSDILWIKATEKFLLVGTLAGNFVVRGAGEFDPITPNAISIRPIDSMGSAPIQPINSDSRVYFVERGSETVRGLEFNFAIRGYDTNDISLLAKHIGKAKIRRLVYFQKEPNRVVAVLENGQIAMIVADRQQQQAAWSRINHGSGDIIDANVAFDGSGGDKLFVLVKRTINGEENTYIEFIEDETFYLSEVDFYTGDKDVDAVSYADHIRTNQLEDVRLDSKTRFSPKVQGAVSIQANTGNVIILGLRNEFGGAEQLLIPGDLVKEIGGPGVASITNTLGATSYQADIVTPFSSLSLPVNSVYVQRPVFDLSHLAGLDVVVVIDSKPYKRTVPVNGQLDITDITMDNPETDLVFTGVIYKGLIKSLPLIGVTQLGETDYKKKNISNMFIKLENSLGLQYGTDPYNLNSLKLRTDTDNIFEQVPYFTGLTEPLLVEDESRREQSMYLVQDQPFPCTVVSYGYYIKSEDM